MRLRSLGIALLLGPAFGPAGQALSQGITFNQEQLVIVSQTGRHKFTVDVADNESRAELGLRYRHSIEPDGGMLILQSSAAPGLIAVSTLGQSLPVDLLFIASDGIVREVLPCIPTDSSTPFVSTAPVGAALELACGTVTREGILAGDRVQGAGLGASGQP
jgi:uncharacterized protein